MKRISAYQATDGTLFDDKKACADHQRALNVLDGIRKIAERMENDPKLLCSDLGPNVTAIVSSEQLMDFILDNAEHIKLALAGKVVPDMVVAAAAPEPTADEGADPIDELLGDLENDGAASEEAFLAVA